MGVDDRIAAVPWRLRGLLPAGSTLLFGIAWMRGQLLGLPETDSALGLFWALPLALGVSVAWQLIDSTKPSSVLAVRFFCFLAWASSVDYLFANPYRLEVIVGSVLALGAMLAASVMPSISETQPDSRCRTSGSS